MPAGGLEETMWESIMGRRSEGMIDMTCKRRAFSYEKRMNYENSTIGNVYLFADKLVTILALRSSNTLITPTYDRFTCTNNDDILADIND